MIFWALVVIGVVSSLVFAKFFADDMAYSKLGWAGFAAFGFFIGLVFTGGFMAVTYLPLSFWTDQWGHTDYTEAHALKAIRTGDSVQGSFFLGSGYIDGENVYNYYYINDAGNIQMNSIDSDNVEIVEDATSGTARIEETHWKMPWWWGPMDLDESYVIHVPEGSIKPLVNMDLPS